jgi:hypothetical protein
VYRVTTEHSADEQAPTQERRRTAKRGETSRPYRNAGRALSHTNGSHVIPNVCYHKIELGNRPDFSQLVPHTQNQRPIWSGLVLERYSVRTSKGTKAILTEVTGGFPQSLPSKKRDIISFRSLLLPSRSLLIHESSIRRCMFSIATDSTENNRQRNKRTALFSKSS